jgi:hypothetical protein
MPRSQASRRSARECRIIQGRNSSAPTPKRNSIRSCGAKEPVTPARVATGYAAQIRTTVTAAA